jgi:hypothetical protein
MTDYADLEIGLRRHPASGYEVDLRYSQPDSDADIRLTRRAGDAPSIEFDRDRLRELVSDPAAYGRLLGETLLSDPELRTAFEQARASAQSLNVSLRVRLLIDPSAAELHSLHWETLRDPRDGALLFTGENIAFSRYLSSFDWRPVRLRSQSELKALVVVANPIGLDKYDLPPADVTQELAHVQNNLGNIKSTALASGGSANLNRIVTNLRDGYDILYVICHGSTRKGDTWLWLEDEEGNVARTSGTDIVTRLIELPQRPRLIVLAACQGAGQGEAAHTDDEGALAALGPRLAEAGIPAVIAMQGTVSVKTVGDFMPAFFQELQRDGQIDRAMAVARGVVRDRPDYWMPVLFMRLKNGRIWYVPGFGDDRKNFEKWPTIVGRIREGKCTPILGPGLRETLLGSSRDIARHWAEQYRFPLRPHEREDLPQVAQFLSVNQEKDFPLRELRKYLISEIRQRYANDLPDELRTDANPDDLFAVTRSDDELLDEMLTTVGKKRREANPQDSYKTLARLPFPLYITTNPDNLLVDALKEAGKDPQIELCPWNEYIEQGDSLDKRLPDYRPSVKQPLVFFLFGRLNEPKSLVITEDDYFDYLIGVTGNKDLIPKAVRRSMADTALLFLGFQLEDWNFRVVYRSIIGQQGSARRGSYAHVAGQIEPEEGRLLEPERARKYMEQYFQDSDISLYWGSSEDFLTDLVQQAKTKPSA